MTVGRATKPAVGLAVPDKDMRLRRPVFQRVLGVVEGRGAPACHPVQPIRRDDRGDFGVISHRDVQRLAIPAQIGHPFELGDLAERLPPRGPVPGLPPGAEGKVGHAVIDGGQRLGRAQADHPGVGGPGPFVAGRILVRHEQVAGAETALAAADDDDVEDVLARGGARLVGYFRRHGDRKPVTGENAPVPLVERTIAWLRSRHVEALYSPYLRRLRSALSSDPNVMVKMLIIRSADNRQIQYNCEK